MKIGASTVPQLSLPLEVLPPRYAAADLLENPAQDQARAWLERTADWPGSRMALWGGPGSGKTHLVHAWAERHGAAILEAAPAEWPRGPLAIDSLDEVPDELALFHLLNAAAEARYPLLLTSRVAPGRLPVRLPDLSSRLRGAFAVEIGSAPDEFLARLLKKLLGDRQLSMRTPIQTWLLDRIPRNPHAVRDAVARLDAYSLAAGRKIDAAMVGAALGLKEPVP